MEIIKVERIKTIRSGFKDNRTFKSRLTRSCISYEAMEDLKLTPHIKGPFSYIIKLEQGLFFSPELHDLMVEGSVISSVILFDSQLVGTAGKLEFKVKAHPVSFGDDCW